MASRTINGLEVPLSPISLSNLQNIASGSLLYRSSAWAGPPEAIPIDTAMVGYAKLAGRTSGQVLIGGDGVTDALILQGTSGNGTITSHAIRLLVGNNGDTIALIVLNNGNIGINQPNPSAGFHITKNGAASTPSELLDGTWFSGGTAITTKPQLLIEPAETTSTNWSTNGTGLGVNAPNGFSGSLLDLQVNGAIRVRINQSGRIYSGATHGFLNSGTNAGTLKLQDLWTTSTVNYVAVSVGDSTYTQTSGSNGILSISPTYNQSSGNASNTDLLINRTETAIGSGNQYLIDTKVNSSSKFSVSNAGTIKNTGGTIRNIVTITNTYTVLSTDYTVVGNKSTNFTITLPTAVVGQIFNIKNINTGIITVDGAGSDTIDGELTQTVNQWENLTIQCNAVNSWIIL